MLNIWLSFFVKMKNVKSMQQYLPFCSGGSGCGTMRTIYVQNNFVHAYIFIYFVTHNYLVLSLEK